VRRLFGVNKGRNGGGGRESNECNYYPTRQSKARLKWGPGHAGIHFPASGEEMTGEIFGPAMLGGTPYFSVASVLYILHGANPSGIGFDNALRNDCCDSSDPQVRVSRHLCQIFVAGLVVDQADDDVPHDRTSLFDRGRCWRIFVSGWLRRRVKMVSSTGGFGQK
jgi:hypothetical protein